MNVTCKSKARQYVHVTAAGGGALAVAPVPGIGTIGLTALEGTLIYWIGRIYGEKLDKSEILMILGSLEIASLGVKAGLLEALNFIPIAGWLLKVPLAASIIEGIGALAISYFEDKYPGKLYAAIPEVEQPGAGTSAG